MHTSTISSNSAQLLYGSRVFEVLQYYYSPTIGREGTTLAGNIYCFIGRTDPWEDDVNPPEPSQDQRSLKQYFKNIIAAKKAGSSDISPVIPRVDWTSGIVYDYYKDTVDMVNLNADGLLVKKFYARNRFDQVFECLWNANGAPSTSEPQFLPGTYDSAFIFYGADGYKWKYLYTIDNGIKQKFLDSDWIPVPLADLFPNPITPSVGLGGIDVINVTNSGSGYVANGVTVVITGDGSGAEAVPSVNAAGYITDVTVINSGSNYTYADISFSVPPQYPTPNTIASAIAPIAPVGGHGFDPI